MDKIVRKHINTGLLYLLLGIILGLAIAAFPGIFRKIQAVHLHLALIGGLLLIVIGNIYHVALTSGQKIYSEKLANTSFLFINVGLIGLTVSWLAVNLWSHYFSDLLILFGAVEVIALLGAIYNLAKSMQSGQENKE